MINFGLVKLVNHGSTIAFLALKIIFVTMLRWDSKTDFDQYIAKKNIT